MDRYCITRRPAISGGSKAMFIPKRWGFEPGEVVQVVLTTLDGSCSRTMTTQVLKHGNSRYFIIPRSLNMPDADLYTMFLWRVPR